MPEKIVSDQSWEQIKRDVEDAHNLVTKNWENLYQIYPNLAKINYSEPKRFYSDK